MPIISASLSISTAGIRGILTDHSPRLSVGMSVGLSVWWVNCGRMAECIQMQFGAVSGVG